MAETDDCDLFSFLGMKKKTQTNVHTVAWSQNTFKCKMQVENVFQRERERESIAMH